ncbi:MAG: class I SAM-dependent methyltransferase, partial [Deltaproteobacteria bacterium]
MRIERIPAPFASLYEKAARLVVEDYYMGIAQEIADFLNAGLILDLGTGPGYLPIEIVKRSPQLHVVGIDLSRRLIKMAQSKAFKAGLDDRLHFEMGNAARLTYHDNTYDMVISTGMLHVLRDPLQVLKESYRVLKPGGEAWIYDPARVTSQVDMKTWRASLSLSEKLMKVIFSLFARLNPPHHYDKGQATA